MRSQNFAAMHGRHGLLSRFAFIPLDTHSQKVAGCGVAVLSFENLWGLFTYSVLKLFTGFTIAAFIAWKLTEMIATAKAAIPARANIHQLNVVW